MSTALWAAIRDLIRQKVSTYGSNVPSFVPNREGDSNACTLTVDWSGQWQSRLPDHTYRLNSITSQNRGTFISNPVGACWDLPPHSEAPLAGKVPWATRLETI
jgi:hypothetical protein